MSAIVSELYCFYGKKEEFEKFYQSFKDWLKEDHGVSYDEDTQNKILTQFGIKNDSTGNTTLKVELQAACTSLCSDLEELIQKSNADVSFKMCSHAYSRYSFYGYDEKYNLWYFNDDIEGKYLPESYMVNSKFVDEESRFSKLTEKHFYTEPELKIVLDECFNESKSVDEYIELFKELNETNAENIWIDKLQKGNRKDLLLCNPDKDLLESLKDPSDEENNRNRFHSEVYVAAWLNKYGKDENYRTYSEVGDKWEDEMSDKVEAFRWYVEGAKNKEIFSLVKIAQGYDGDYGDEFFDYVTNAKKDDDNDDKAIKYLTEAYEEYCNNPDDSGYRGIEYSGIAAFWLGMICEADEQDEKANDYFRKAIELGHNGAKVIYAQNLFDGTGVDEDESTALDLAAEVLEDGTYTTWAKVALAMMHEQMFDSDTAEELYKSAALDGPGLYNEKAIEWLKENGYDEWLEENNIEANE